jgi:hypothetical protein
MKNEMGSFHNRTVRDDVSYLSLSFDIQTILTGPNKP